MPALTMPAPAPAPDFAALLAGAPVLLVFTAAWCRPSQRAAQVIAACAGMVPGLAGPVVMDIDADPDAAIACGVSAVPCWVVVGDGQALGRKAGHWPLDTIKHWAGGLLAKAGEV